MRLVPIAALKLPSGRALRLGLATLLAAIAMAGPRWGEETTILRGEGIDIVLAMDASLSMMATDERPEPAGAAQAGSATAAGRLAW